MRWIKNHCENRYFYLCGFCKKTIENSSLITSNVCRLCMVNTCKHTCKQRKGNLNIFVINCFFLCSARRRGGNMQFSPQFLIDLVFAYFFSMWYKKFSFNQEKPDLSYQKIALVNQVIFAQ